MNKKEILLKKKLRAAKKYHSRCYCCHREFRDTKASKKLGWTFHHLFYKEGEPVYSEYKDSLNYQLALLPFVLKNPSQFLLLCKVHHHYLEWAKSCGDPLWRRICKARKMSRRC